MKSSIVSRRCFTSILGVTASLPNVAFAGRVRQREADVVIIGAGLGGCAAAIACLQNGLTVILTEPTQWIGGQLTSQGVPPDEHRFIETHGANRSYRELRNRIRQYYRDNYRLTKSARSVEHFNPGQGSVSRLCCEPRVALAVLEQWLLPYRQNGQLSLLLNTAPEGADTHADRVHAVQVRETQSGESQWLLGKYFVDATELGDLLPMTKAEFVTGAESVKQTDELHAAAESRPENQQAFTVCFAVDFLAGNDFTIQRPAEYDFWREFVPQLTPAWPGRLLDLTYSHPRTLHPKLLGFDPTGAPTGSTLNLWNYRRIIDKSQFETGQFEGDVSLINWPQNDYMIGNLVGVAPEVALAHVERAKQLSLALLYWLQTEVPRADGGCGFPGLRLRGDLMGTEDGLAKAPYIRESRRIVAEFTITEKHVGVDNRNKLFGDRAEGKHAERFYDSVAIGSYPIDLHPSTGGDNYIDFETYPFEVSLGALLPVRLQNLLPACKNIGTTHMTSGCYRLHPVEWGIGEAVGHLVTYALEHQLQPTAIRAEKQHLEQFQKLIQQQGVELRWPV